jgi:hypothetical protein
MLPAVDFNYESTFLANEVSDVPTDRDLTPKTQTTETMRPQSRPQTPFSIRHLAT